MLSIYEKIHEALGKNKTCWLATVINATGSTPATEGMKMLVYPDGNFDGTIGGGEIEKLILERILREKPQGTEKWSYNLGTGDEESEQTGMICGGIQEMLIERIISGSRLYIIGGGHCGMALSRLASENGFSVTVLDNREEWASPEKHPSASELICSPYDGIDRHIEFSENTYIVIMTHGHTHDEKVLRQLIGHEYKYLGMLGSARKVKTVFEKLKSEGIPEDRLKKVYSPAGFDTGSHTPNEIAVTITAQLTAVKNSRDKIIFNSNPLL